MTNTDTDALTNDDLGGRVMIYDKRQFTVDGLTISGIRSDNPLHAGPGESRAEIMFKREQDYHWSDLWVGHPAKVGDVMRWIRASLIDGATIDEIEDYILAHSI